MLIFVSERREAMKYRNLPLGSDNVLRAMIKVVAPQSLDLGYDPTEKIVAEADDFFNYLPVILRVGLLIGLFLFNFGALFYLKKPFTACENAEVMMRYYQKWAESPVYLFRTMVKGLKVIILLTFFSLRETWEILDYHPEEWHRERVGEYPEYYREAANG